MNVAQDLIGGRYRLLEIIGAGGTGRVWLADDELLRRRVAVKEIGTPTGVSPAQLLDAQLTTMREARAAARLDHPGVVAIYDVVWRPERSWIVMEYVESRSLDAVIRQDGPLPHREAARIGLGVLAALRAAHAAGVLHRDVKPHNVLLATDGRVVLTDFGLAKIGTDPGAEPLMGSPFYVAPERLSGDDAGAAADLWSLGATLYAAVEGRAPFERPTAGDSLAAVLTEAPDPARRPGALTPIINGLLTRDPARRLTAADVQPRLQRVANRAVGIFPMLPSRQRTRLHETATAPGRPRNDGESPPIKDAPKLPAPPGASALGMAMLLNRTVGPARKRLARSTRVSLAVAAALLAGTAGTALALDLGPGPSPVIPVSSADSGPVPPCAAGPVVTGKTQARGYAVPTGWLWHTDPTGFDVAVPKGWTRSQEGTAACFRDPGGSRSFRVDASARLSGTALAGWPSREEDALAGGYLPGYQRVSLAPLPGRDGAAWEYTWQPDGEQVRRHERRTLLTVAGSRAYLVEWSAPDQDWPGTEPYLQLVLASLS